jgi:regulator of protease activity HflC (stomatin/prohibitin superfamily)
MAKRPNQPYNIIRDDAPDAGTGHAARLAAVFGPLALLGLVILALASCSYKTIPAGHAGVATLFGDVVPQPYTPGMHFPVNPLYKWEVFDAKQKTLKETVDVPSQDQLQTSVDVSIQYRVNGAMAPQIYADTGTVEQLVEVHLRPNVRSILREQGKTIQRAEDFFLEQTQQRLQSDMLVALQARLSPQGLEVSDVLIRDISLPPFINQAIERKKEREQEAERQKAELERFATEQEQVLVEAKAKRAAAEQEAEQRKLLADAQAYEIERINAAIAQNPAYIQLEALKTLREMSKDPAAKLYFLDSNSPTPVPLMNIGQDGLRMTPRPRP